MDVINLVKEQCTIYRSERFLEKPQDQVDKMIDLVHLSKSIANVSFKFNVSFKLSFYKVG